LPLLLLLTGALLNAQSGQLQMDGFFSDWQELSFLEKEADPSTAVDLIEFSVANDEDFLYIRAKLDREILFQESSVQLWLDADNDPDTGVEVEGIGAELYYHFGQRRGAFLGQEIGHFDIGLTSLPTYSNNEFEIRLRRDANPLNLRQLITSSTIQLILVGNTLNNDALPESGAFSYTLEEGPFSPYTPTEIAKTDPAFIRLMNYNILFDRPLEAAYKGQFQRVVQAVNADVFCFNEFFDSSASQVKDLMDETLPLNNGHGWYARQVDGDNVTCSRYPILQTLRVTELGNISANLIDLPASYETDLLVIVCHFSCCDQETERQLQVDAVAAFIDEAKKQGGRMDIEENTPILITGDFNMVGLQQQRTTLLTGDIQNTQLFDPVGRPDWDNTPISDLAPLHTHYPIATTWINPFSSFSPGRLDYILYSDSRLEAQKSFILQTAEMPPEALSANNLLSTDTDFSDHLPIVGDFKIVDLITSVEEKNVEASFRVFPNPFTDQLTIEKINESFSPATIRIYGLDGKIIAQSQMEVGKKEMNLPDLPAGIYVVKMRQKGKVEQMLIIKNP